MESTKYLETISSITEELFNKFYYSIKPGKFLHNKDSRFWPFPPMINMLFHKCSNFMPTSSKPKEMKVSKKQLKKEKLIDSMHQETPA